MKFLKPRTIIISTLVIVSGAVLLNTSQNVQRAEEHVQVLEQAAAIEEEKVRMLNAEWQALNRPERLERLANEYLELVPPTPEQIAGDNATLSTTNSQTTSTDNIKKHNISIESQKNVNILINEMEGE